MTDHDKDMLLRELREDVKELHVKLDSFLGRISAAEAYIKGHSALFIFLGSALLGMVGYLIKGDF
jgi:hypothetical protein